MRIEIEIPKEFECDYNADKFKEFFSRVLYDIMDGLMCGQYEMETAKMFIKAFEESKKAYDVEEVVAELEKLKESVFGCDDTKCSKCKYKSQCFNVDKGHKVALDKAISIVRGKE